jgi:hypothetical protein
MNRDEIRALVDRWRGLFVTEAKGEAEALREFGKELWTAIREHGPIIAAIAAIVFTMVVMIVVAIAIAIWLTEQPWFIPIAILCAWGLFIFRNRARFWYGVLEAVVGVSVIYTSIANSSATGLTRLLTVIGGIYIVIRGFDNIDQGISSLRHTLSPNLFASVFVIWNLFFKLRTPPLAELPQADPS